MANMSFNADESVASLRKSFESNNQLKEALNNASKKISQAFCDAGDIISGNLGLSIQAAWGGGSADFFKKKLQTETEYFLRDKVSAIIDGAMLFAHTTTTIYQSAEKDK